MAEIWEGGGGGCQGTNRPPVTGTVSGCSFSTRAPHTVHGMYLLSYEAMYQTFRVTAVLCVHRLCVEPQEEGFEVEGTIKRRRRKPEKGGIAGRRDVVSRPGSVLS